MNRRDEARDDGARGEDHDWVDPAGTGLLRQTFGAMADGVDPASPTGPAAALPAMSRRVRRRRTAKIGGIGGGALAAAAVLVLGATQLAPPDRSAPLPATPEPSASAAPEIELREGEQPGLLKDTRLACGANLRDIVFSPDARLVAGDPETITFHGDGEWGYPQTSVPIGVEGNTAEEDVQAPTLVWTDGDGRVVDLGSWEKYPMYLTREEGEPAAFDDGESSCLAEGAGASLPDGTYEVFPTSVEYSSSRLLFTDDPLEVTIEDGQTHWGTGGMEPPVPIELPGAPDTSVIDDEGLGSAVIDRTGQWERRDTYQVMVQDPEALSGTDYRVEAWCSSTDPGDSLGYEQLGSWDGAETGGSVACTGEKVIIDGAAGYQPPTVPGSPDGVRLTDVPDGVVLAYVRLLPTP